LLKKDPQYEGLFFVGVKTTGAFCRSTCPARKPKFENCEFFGTMQEALLASFRPCKRCRPLSLLNSPSDIVQKLVDAVEKEPEKRWKESDLYLLNIDPSTARRQFQNRFGLTFFAYARSKRLGASK
jgi:AraC family transcriptional regulator of adaptative response/methylated-DNA-[protein]-cysteine methyltransferase